MELRNYYLQFLTTVYLLSKCYYGILAGRSSLHSGWRLLIANDTFSYSVRHFQRPVGGAVTRSNAAVIEGDIRARVPVYKQQARNGQRFFNAVVDETKTWPRGIVPYVIASEFDWPERNLIRSAMDDIEEHTCVRFVEWPAGSAYVSHRDYIRIEKSGDCSSFVGRMNMGEQDVQLSSGCLKLIGEVQHELLHALGLYHEQSRMDRDDYVHIVQENIYAPPGSELTAQFEKYESNTFGLPYDYESIMHYGHNYFSRSAHLPTIVPRRQRTQQPVRMGNRAKMTDIDAQKISYLYKCLFISYEGVGSATTPSPVRHRTRSRPSVQSTTTAARAGPRNTAAVSPPVVRLSDDRLYQLRKNKYNESRIAWRRFKTAVKQSGSGSNGNLLASIGIPSR